MINIKYGSNNNNNINAIIIVILIHTYFQNGMIRYYLFYNIDQVRVWLAACMCVYVAIMTAILLPSRHLNLLLFFFSFMFYSVFFILILMVLISFWLEKKKRKKWKKKEKTLIQEINSEIIEWRSNMNMNFIFEMKVKAIIINQKTKNKKCIWL